MEVTLEPVYELTHTSWKRNRCVEQSHKLKKPKIAGFKTQVSMDKEHTTRHT